MRVIRIRQFEMNSDTGENLAGFDLGPLSPEHMLAAQGGCIAHTAEMIAASTAIELEDIGVDGSAHMHPLAQTTGYEDGPLVAYNTAYTLKIRSPEPAHRIEELHRQVEEACPILKLIKGPQAVGARLEVTSPPCLRDNRGGPGKLHALSWSGASGELKGTVAGSAPGVNPAKRASTFSTSVDTRLRG